MLRNLLVKILCRKKESLTSFSTGSTGESPILLNIKSQFCGGLFGLERESKIARVLVA